MDEHGSDPEEPHTGISVTIHNPGDNSEDDQYRWVSSSPDEADSTQSTGHEDDVGSESDGDPTWLQRVRCPSWERSERRKAICCPYPDSQSDTEEEETEEAGANTDQGLITIWISGPNADKKRKNVEDYLSPRESPASSDNEDDQGDDDTSMSDEFPLEDPAPYNRTVSLAGVMIALYALRQRMNHTRATHFITELLIHSQWRLMVDFRVEWDVNIDTVSGIIFHPQSEYNTLVFTHPRKAQWFQRRGYDFPNIYPTVDYLSGGTCRFGLVYSLSYACFIEISKDSVHYTRTYYHLDTQMAALAARLMQFKDFALAHFNGPSDTQL
ncbi:hypothetical protein IWQ60_011566 [Tieghemiomyces parasiticus]|uniref:Uncharacterized protein n=1 Tax=Tieghemiomyces parasiticus TaxID=78921 RepID=A0A9W8DIB9_9FUNG|nr:hypothetical protein IWQ60_011566 [Tieghemiomyces parasiticus]